MKGMTLAELMVSLTVIAIISVAVTYLLTGASNMNKYVVSQGNAMWEVDFSSHRILANVKAAVIASPPAVTTDANGQSRLTLTVPDVASGTNYLIKYYCSGTTAPYALVEDDPRYNVGGVPNVITNNVVSFGATLTGTPTVKVLLDLVARPTGSWAVRRHFYIDCRGL